MLTTPYCSKDEQILKLIKLYHEQPCLWDNNLKESKSHKARKLALDYIATHMGASVEDVKRKLNNLRSQFRREDLRMAKLKTNKPKWFYFNALKFLDPNSGSMQINADPLDTINDSKKSQSDEADFAYEQDYNIDADDENTRSEEISLKQLSSNLSHSSEPTISTDSRSKLSSNFKDTSHEVIVIPRQSKERDEYDVFGENVANELRSLKKKKNLQYELKCKIIEAILNVNKAAYESTTREESCEMKGSKFVEY